MVKNAWHEEYEELQKIRTVCLDRGASKDSLTLELLRQTYWKWLTGDRPSRRWHRLPFLAQVEREILARRPDSCAGDPLLLPVRDIPRQEELERSPDPVAERAFRVELGAEPFPQIAIQRIGVAPNRVRTG